MELVSGRERKADRFQYWSLITGVAQIVLGVLTAILSIFMVTATVSAIGFFLLFRGLFDIIYTLWAQRQHGFWWRISGGVLSVVVGAVILANPLLTVEALALQFGTFFLVIGLYKVIAATLDRFSGWIWVAGSGLVAFAFGSLLFAQQFELTIRTIGILVGIEIAIHGLSLTTLSHGSKSHDEDSAEPV